MVIVPFTHSLFLFSCSGNPVHLFSLRFTAVLIQSYDGSWTLTHHQQVKRALSSRRSQVKHHPFHANASQTLAEPRGLSLVITALM